MIERLEQRDSLPAVRHDGSEEGRSASTLDPEKRASAERRAIVLQEGRARSLKLQRQSDSETRDLSKRLTEAKRAIAEIKADDARLRGKRDYYQSHVESLARQMDELGVSEQSAVDRLIERTLAEIETLEKTLALTDLDFETILDRTETESLSQGGPFVPGIKPTQRGTPARFQSSLGALDLHLDRWDSLSKAIRSIPLTAPLNKYRVTSRYGNRKDPVNGRSARHNGVDLKAPRLTVVFSPASGTVILAGWKGDYGRVVEIDHGNGIVTLYAHLQKILVKKGEKVQVSDRIGLVGSSGRTTGAHLHYEIQVDGRHTNPIKFLRAGQRIFSE